MDRSLELEIDEALQRIPDVWPLLREQRVFITGGTGFFGKWLLSTFCRANDVFGLRASAVVLTRDPSRILRQEPGLRERRDLAFHAGDFQSFPFPEGEFPLVVHAATETDSVVAPLEARQLFDANVEGTRRVLDFAAQAGTQRLLFVSSGAVYGRQPLDVLRIEENSLVAPDTMDLGTAYGQSKRVSEFLVAAHASKYGTVVTSARCFAFVGPHLALDANFAIGNFIRDAMKGGPIHIQGDGTPLRSYLYMADLAVWLWTLLLRGKNGRAYNVGSDEPISIADLARLVAKVVEPTAEVIVAKAAVTGQPPARYVPSIERARSELGLEPWTDLCKAVARTAAWYRNKTP